VRSGKHQTGDFKVPRHPGDPQNESKEPVCEKKSFTYEPGVSMCNKCEVNNCSDRAFNE